MPSKTLSPPFPHESTSTLQGQRPKRRDRRFCCCCPLSAGVGLLSLFLLIPSVAMVLLFNLASMRGISVRVNAPVEVRIVYTIIYTFYAILGLMVGLMLRRIAEHRRFRALILLYWTLIATTIIEGVYFGIMIARLKSKLMSYCDDVDSSSVLEQPTHPSTLNSTLSTDGTVHKRGPLGISCHKGQGFVNAFYIAGPGGWILLHVLWIITVALYTKALRRRYPSEPDRSSPYPSTASRKNRTPSPSGTPFSMPELQAGATKSAEFLPQHHHHPSADSLQENDIVRPSLGFRALIGSTMKQWKSSPQSPSTKNTLAHTRPVVDTEQESDEEPDKDMEGKDQTDLESGRQPKVGCGTSIPADGKGWWYRQLEGRRRGETCPCMVQNFSAEHAVVSRHCWCGKPRQLSPSPTSSSFVAATAPAIAPQAESSSRNAVAIPVAAESTAAAAIKPAAVISRSRSQSF